MSTFGRATRVVVGLAMAGMLAACSSTASTGGGGKAGEDYYSDFKAPTIAPEDGVNDTVDTSRFKKADTSHLVIGYADASLGNSWRVMVKADTEYGISQLKGAKLVYTNANDSASKQISDMNDLITQKVDAIILAATDVKALCPSIAKATAAGIPVIVQERMVECSSDAYTTFASLDVAQNATYNMEYIAQRLGGKGEIAIISGIPGSGHTVATEDAYKEVLKKYPGIKVDATEYAQYDPTKAREATAAILTAHPNVQAFAAISGNLTIGVYQAVKEAGKLGQMKAWIGDDANGWMLLHADNNLPAMTAPYPTKIGRTTVELAAKILSGQPVPRTYEVAKWADPVDFSRNIKKYANHDRPDEWWYTDLPCSADPFCKH